MTSLLVPLALIMTMTSAYAAKIIGNGGDVLVCPDRTPKVQLLDFVEARVLRKKTVRLWSPPGSNYQDKLDALVVNVGRRFPQLALALRAEIANFEARNVKETDIELEDINDSYHKFRLPGCHVEQIANQSLPMFEDDPWVLINGNLWNLLDAFDKAGLVIHEVLYRIGLKHGLEHSIGIRYLTGLLFQEDLKQVNDQQWIEAMLHSRMKYFELGSLRFPLFQGEEKDCELVPGSIECRGGPSEFKPARLTFGSDRSLSTVVFENGVQQPFEFSFGNIRAILYSSDVVFSRNGDRNFFYAEGRLQMQSNGSMDVSILDVQGKFEPATGQFTGEYRFMRPDLIVEEKWNHFSGVLSDLHAARPGQIGPGHISR